MFSLSLSLSMQKKILIDPCFIFFGVKQGVVQEQSRIPSLCDVINTAQGSCTPATWMYNSSSCHSVRRHCCCKKRDKKKTVPPPLHLNHDCAHAAIIYMASGECFKIIPTPGFNTQSTSTSQPGSFRYYTSFRTADASPLQVNFKRAKAALLNNEKGLPGIPFFGCALRIDQEKCSILWISLCASVKESIPYSSGLGYSNDFPLPVRVSRHFERRDISKPRSLSTKPAYCTVLSSTAPGQYPKLVKIGFSRAYQGKIYCQSAFGRTKEEEEEEEREQLRWGHEQQIKRSGSPLSGSSIILSIYRNIYITEREREDETGGLWWQRVKKINTIHACSYQYTAQKKTKKKKKLITIQPGGHDNSSTSASNHHHRSILPNGPCVHDEEKLLAEDQKHQRRRRRRRTIKAEAELWSVPVWLELGMSAARL